MRGYEVVEAAWSEFDAWVSAQDDDVKELGILEQIELYAAAPTKVGAA